jgi:hypothetical protein
MELVVPSWRMDKVGVARYAKIVDDVDVTVTADERRILIFIVALEL